MKFEDKFFIYDVPKKFSIKQFLKSTYHFFKSFLYFFLICFNKTTFVKKDNIFSIVSIFKNEAPYLKEWIEYHKIVGVDHFYLYNNNSEDGFNAVLEPYVKQGIVTLLDWTKNQAQMECYHDAIMRFRGESNWLAFIDIDEFIVPNSTSDIKDFLNNFKNKPSVLAYWKYFGASGKIHRDINRLVCEDFTVAWNKYADIGKCFYNTAFDFDENFKGNNCLHHFFWASWKGIHLPPVNVFGKVVLNNKHKVPKGTDPLNFPLQINHYFTKSYDEYKVKKTRGDVYYKLNPHDDKYFFYHNGLATCTDHHIFKYLVQLKLAMGISDR